MAASDVMVGLSAAEIHERAARPENRGAYTLYRADTHGTEVPVVMGVSQSFAQSVMLQMERKPHHQGYWVRIPGRAP